MKLHVAFLLCFCMTVSCRSRADDHEQQVKDFQNAINYMQDDKGCLSIPYSDLQDSCQRKQQEVNKLCKESGPWNCDEVDPKVTQKKIETLKTDRDALLEQRKALEAQSPTTDDEKAKKDEEIKKIDDKLDEMKRTQSDLETEVRDSTKLVNDRMYLGKSCRDARQSVMEVFRDAKSRANSEHDADVEPRAKQLISGWEKKEPGHEQAIEEVKNGLDRCEKVLYDIGHIGTF